MTSSKQEIFIMMALSIEKCMEIVKLDYKVYENRIHLFMDSLVYGQTCLLSLFMDSLWTHMFMDRLVYGLFFMDMLVNGLKCLWTHVFMG